MACLLVWGAGCSSNLLPTAWQQAYGRAERTVNPNLPLLRVTQTSHSSNTVRVDAEPRLGRRTVLTFPLLPPPQKN